MKYIKEKIAYLRGYADALQISDETNEGKILLKMMEILDDVGDALSGLAEAQSEMENYVEMIDDDISDLEEFVLDCVEDDDEIDDDYDFEEDDDLYEVVCPKCGKVYLSDFDSFEKNEVFCPSCGEHFVLEESIAEKLIHDDDCQCDECQNQD